MNYIEKINLIKDNKYVILNSMNSKFIMLSKNKMEKENKTPEHLTNIISQLHINTKWLQCISVDWYNQKDDYTYINKYDETDELNVNILKWNYEGVKKIQIDSNLDCNLQLNEKLYYIFRTW